MPLHSSLSGSELHDPKGVSPTPLTLADNTANAYKIAEASNNYFVITTTNSSETMSYGNATTAPSHFFYGKMLLQNALELPNLGTRTATFSLSAANSGVELISTSGGAVTVNLPTVASAANLVTWIVDIGRAAATNNITVDGSGAETINGATTYVMDTNGEAICLYCDGTEWVIIGAANVVASSGSGYGVLSKTANYSVVVGDYTGGGVFVRAARSITITLGAVASITNGLRTVVRRTDDGTTNGTIKVQPATGESLNGVANGFVELTNDQQSVLLIKDSGGYWEIAP